MESNWYCIVTNPNCQRRAEAGLAELGYRVFWPRVKRWVSHSRTKTAKERPLLWTYLFVEIEDKAFGPVHTVDGVERFVEVGGHPVTIPRAWVEHTLHRYLRGEWDYVTPEVYFLDDAGKWQVRTNDRVPIGARIRVMEGEFANVLAKVIDYEKGKRLKIVPLGQYKPVITRETNVRAA